MNKDPLRFVVVASTAGSVMNELLKNDFFRSLVHSVVVDRDCAALDKARAHGVHRESFLEADADGFSDKLLNYLNANHIDYVISYYTSCYSAKLRETYQDRLVNIHPSILPAFKGVDGFGDNVLYHAKLVGNTIEFIADVMDQGKIIMQTACPYDTTVPLAVVRHRVFVQQCKALLQVTKWLTEGRVMVTGRCVSIAGASYDGPQFSPALDFGDAIALSPELNIA